MWWLLLPAAIVALAFLPLGIKAKYDEGGAAAWLILGPLRTALYPSRKKEKKPEKEASAEQEKKTSGKEKKGGSFSDFFPLVEAVLDFVGDLLSRKMRVKKLQAKVILAGDDPCDLAVNYGRAWAAIGNLQPQLEKIFVIKKRKIDVECDFCADQTKITARLDLTITLGRILATVFVYAIRALIQFLKINKKRKGGAAK